MAKEQGSTSLTGPRRTALAQDRSKQTRRRLVRAALQLWTERGFDEGVDATTVEEIAQVAGVTKGTFYFHFAHKDDIFLELGYGTAAALYEEAVRAAAGRRSGTALVHQLLASLARRVETVPRPAALRAITGFRTVSGFNWRVGSAPVPGRHSIQDALAVALDVAVAQGELPPDADTQDLARMITALAMDACLQWANGDAPRLRALLRRRADVILTGARAAAQPSGNGRAARRSART